MLESLSRIDTQLFILINGWHHPWCDALFLAITQLGNGWVAIPLAGAVIAFVTPRKYLARALLFAAIVGTVAGTLNTQIKRLVDRPRPFSYFNHADAPAYSVHVVGEPLRRHSFPSGHTNTAFAAAAILAFLYRGRWYLVFPLALLIGYSRIYVGAHFPLDVLGGMTLGTGVAALCLLFAHRCHLLTARVPLRGSHA